MAGSTAGPTPMSVSTAMVSDFGLIPSTRIRYSGLSGGRQAKSRSSGRARMFIIAAASCTLRVIGPATRPMAGAASGTLPCVGLKPNTPQKAAGMRSDPIRSMATCSGAYPAAQATAAPADEPPVVSAGCHGLRTRRPSMQRPATTASCAAITVLPSTTQPASSSRATTGETPSTSLAYEGSEMSSRTITGTPSSGDCGACLRQRRSEAAALSSAASRLSTRTAPSASSCAVMCSNSASATATGEASCAA